MFCQNVPSNNAYLILISIRFKRADTTLPYFVKLLINLESIPFIPTRTPNLRHYQQAINTFGSEQNGLPVFFFECSILMIFFVF